MAGTTGNGGGVARAATGWGMDTAPRYRSPNNDGRAVPAEMTTPGGHLDNEVPPGQRSGQEGKLETTSRSHTHALS